MRKLFITLSLAVISLTAIGQGITFESNLLYTKDVTVEKQSTLFFFDHKMTLVQENVTNEFIFTEDWDYEAIDDTHVLSSVMSKLKSGDGYIEYLVGFLKNVDTGDIQAFLYDNENPTIYFVGKVKVKQKKVNGVNL